METYTIKEVSKLFDLPASTLRYYEDMELLTQVHINEKIAYYEAIKKAIKEDRELPSWRKFMD